MTKPFLFEGNKRRKQAEQGLAELKAAVDTLIVIPNQRLLSVAGENMSLADAFKRADEVLLNAVQGITDLITVPRPRQRRLRRRATIMSEQGLALMGTGRAAGERRAVEAMQAAISSPLLEDVTIDGATGILVNITGGPNLTLHEVNEAVSMAQSAADPDANIIFGSVIDERLGDEVKITVIATGFQGRESERRTTTAPRARRRCRSPGRPRDEGHPAAGSRAVEAKKADPIRLASPVTAPVTAPVRTPVSFRREPAIFKPLDDEQYDIPAFLRKGGRD